jgi:hypothetical protein
MQLLFIIMKNWIVFALIALVSLLVGYSLRPPIPVDPDAGKFAALKSKLEALGEVDIEEYLRLKDQKARYEKADEILGKIVQLMIYDLGLRQGEGQLARLKGAAAQAKAGAAPSEAMLDPDAAVGSAATRAKAAPALPSVQTPPPAVRDWKQSAEKLKDVYRSDQVADFLKSVEIPDFFGAMKGGTALNQAQVELLNGTFIGRAVFEDPKELPWSVSLFTSAEMQSGQAVGEFEVRLSKNGKQFSRTRSSRKRGEKKPIKQDNFMGIEGEDNAIIINAYGDDGYFQLYFFPRLNEFHGLVYLKKSLGVFDRKGVVHLTKR